ncbi:MAG TPA: glycoside hydrolase family 30 beta sandwich domain-containing protein [Pseudonocardia sp.]|nr:glycoside hydrolase family 30 beta sandwich domain-containing protein [Pseudonocardia sp.]
MTLTNAPLTDALSSMPEVDFCAGSLRGAPVIRVSDAVRYQRVQGFGAAMTDSSAWLLMTKLGPSTRATVFQSLFGSGGLRLNFLRVPMGASDFSAGGVPYTYDDVPAGKTDPTLANFSIAHDLAYIIPALRQARALSRGLRLLANPWSPPAWMKANGRLDNVEGSGQILASAYPALARYFVRFLKSYAAHGVAVNAVTAQNEPGVSTQYPGAVLGATAESAFISGYLAPALRAARLPVGIYGDDLSWDRGSYATALASGEAAGALAGIAWHCYRGSPDEMTSFHHLYPTMNQMVTECSPEILGFSTIELLISSLRNDATTVSVWNIALNADGGPVQPPDHGCPGCKGIVTVTESNHTVRYNGKYYELGQVSKFVRPGAVRIASTSSVTYGTDRPGGLFRPSPGVDNVAVVNPDGSKVLVATNTSQTSRRFVVSWHGGAFRYSLPSRASVTFTWR